MADKNDSAALLGYVTHFSQALLLESCVSDGEYFINHQDFRLEMRCHRERQAQVHAARVPLDGSVDELLHLGKGDNLVELTFNLRVSHAEDRAIQIDIVPARQLG